MKNYIRAALSLLLAVLVIAAAILLTPYIKKRLSRGTIKKTTLNQHASRKPSNTVTLQNSFKEAVLSKKSPIVAIFFAEWCPSCTIMHPIVEEIAHEFPNVQFVSIDIDDFEDVANNYGIQAIPTFLFFNHGKLLGRSTGYMAKEQFAETITKQFELSKH